MPLDVVTLTLLAGVFPITSTPFGSKFAEGETTVRNILSVQVYISWSSSTVAPNTPTVTVALANPPFPSDIV